MCVHVVQRNAESLWGYIQTNVSMATTCTISPHIETHEFNTSITPTLDCQAHTCTPNQMILPPKGSLNKHFYVKRVSLTYKSSQGGIWLSWLFMYLLSWEKMKKARRSSMWLMCYYLTLDIIYLTLLTIWMGCIIAYQAREVKKQE